MASSPSTLARQNGLLLLPAIAKLARWRFKQMWRFLLVTWLGMLAMVVLVCAGPLFAHVATSAYVRSLIASAPDGSYITIDAISTHPSQEQLQQLEQQIEQLLRKGTLGSYLHDAPQVIVQTPPFDMLAAGKTKPAAFVVGGYDTNQASQHANPVQGRLPIVTSDGMLEIALSQEAAGNLGLHVGSTIQGRYPIVVGSQVWKFRVVGIIAPKMAHDAFWAVANPFSKSSIALNSRYYFVNEGAPSYTVLAANDALRPKIAVLQTTPSGDNFTNAFVLFWRYPFDLAHLDANDLPALSQQTTELDNQVGNILQRNTTDLAYTNIFGTLFTTLEFSASAIVDVQITVTFLLLVILALALFLVSLMSDVLVERQAATIATLRSRGATRWHIFGAFVVQGLILGVLALLAGPLLAILPVWVMARFLLTSDNQSAINVITAHPIQAALDVKEYALIAVVVALIVLIIAVNQATKTDVVSFRRESARPQRVPLWRRFYLDLFIAVLLLAGYAAYSYFWSFLTLSSSRIDPVVYNGLTGVGFFTTPLLVAAVLMLFLRFFPGILRLATFLIAKKRSAPAVLALAQMERTPRPAARIIVLLALAITASCFLFTLIATKDARTSDAATFAVGADFSGPLPTSDSFKTFTALKTQYSTLTGVQSATLGYRDVLDNPLGDIQITAADADTYAHTALWSTQNSSQPLSDLTDQLVAHRSDATTHNVVYALVDSVLWQKYALSQGDSFTLSMNDSGTARVHFIALAHINYIPGTYNTLADPDSDIGLVVDYQSYVTVYAKVSGMALSPNYVWLRTQDDASSLAHIRHVLPDLQDRCMLTTANQENSVHLDIIGVLAIGVGAALLLALLGTLLSSWLNASSRLSGFALVRALGMAPRQVAAVLLWEQSFIYVLAFLLGIGMGAMLTAFAASTVSLLNLSGPSALYNPLMCPPYRLSFHIHNSSCYWQGWWSSVSWRYC